MMRGARVYDPATKRRTRYSVRGASDQKPRAGNRAFGRRGALADPSGVWPLAPRTEGRPARSGQRSCRLAALQLATHHSLLAAFSVWLALFLFALSACAQEARNPQSEIRNPQSQAPAPTCSLVPGWQQAGEARSYAPDNLYDYMDGNSEGYLLYHFAAMKGVTCKSGEDTFIFDVSEMGDADFAWGMFMANRDIRQPIEPIGMAGQVLPRKTTFAKGKYYVEIAASPDKDHRPALRAFVTSFEKLVTGRTTAPAALAWFPKQGLTPDSVRLVPESVLGIRLLRSGFIALYDFGKAFVVPADSPEAATALMEKWKARIGETMPAKLGDEAFTATDKYLNGLFVFRKGRFVAGYANLKPGRDASAEAAQLAASLNP